MPGQAIRDQRIGGIDDGSDGGGGRDGPADGDAVLRKARAADRAHAGASDREMMAAFGWSSSREPAR